MLIFFYKVLLIIFVKKCRKYVNINNTFFELTCIKINTNKKLFKNYFIMQKNTKTYALFTPFVNAILCLAILMLLITKGGERNEIFNN